MSKSPVKYPDEDRTTITIALSICSPPRREFVKMTEIAFDENVGRGCTSRHETFQVPVFL
jgi:hypothetical protein